MANEIEKLNTIEITDIEKVNTLSDDDIEKINTFEFAGFSPPAWGRSRSVVAGGSSTTDSNLKVIQYKTVGATANTVDFGDLQSNRSRHQCAGSNVTRGVFGGGGSRHPSGSPYTHGTPDTDYITIASTGDGTDFGDMNNGLEYGGRCGASNGTLLFSVGGYSPSTGNVDSMEYYTIASTGNGTDAGNLSAVRNSTNSTNGDTRYIVNGGSGVDIMEYNDFSTSANVTDFGDLSANSGNNSSACSAVTAVMHVEVGDGSYAFPTMEYVTVATTADSEDFGDMDVDRGASTATSDGITGEWNGGTNDSYGAINSIEINTIGTPGNGTEVGDLLGICYNGGNTSGV